MDSPNTMILKDAPRRSACGPVRRGSESRHANQTGNSSRFLLYSSSLIEEAVFSGPEEDARRGAACDLKCRFRTAVLVEGRGGMWTPTLSKEVFEALESILGSSEV